VKPAPFAYHRPRTRGEVDDLLSAFGPEAKVLAGGQSLVPLLNMRLATPAHIVDINGLEGEPVDPSTRADGLAFGPLVRHHAVEGSVAVSERLPILREAIWYVGHPAIRSRGTVVGSIAHADPAAELPAVLILVGGDVSVRSALGHRTVKAEDFLSGPFQPGLGDDEWVEEVRFPSPTPQDRRGFAFEEFARRSGDYALCGVAASAGADGAGRVVLALCYLGMGPVPVRLELPPLDPREIADGALAQALAATVRSRLEPANDLHATRDYRLWLAERLGARAARRAAAALVGNDP